MNETMSRILPAERVGDNFFSESPCQSFAVQPKQTLSWGRNHRVAGEKKVKMQNSKPGIAAGVATHRFPVLNFNFCILTSSLRSRPSPTT